MLTSFRGLMAVSLATAGLSLATPAMAQSEDDSGFTTSANVALTTDYRFRGPGRHRSRVARPMAISNSMSTPDGAAI